MKAVLRTVTNGTNTYDALMFCCPGCIAGGEPEYQGLHMLAVNSETVQPSWTWNGDLEKPTLSPSILSNGYCRCHSYLEDGVFRFLEDSDHPLAGQSVPMPDLPDWVGELSDDDEEESNDDG